MTPQLSPWGLGVDDPGVDLRIPLSNDASVVQETTLSFL